MTRCAEFQQVFLLPFPPSGVCLHTPPRKSAAVLMPYSTAIISEFCGLQIQDDTDPIQPLLNLIPGNRRDDVKQTTSGDADGVGVWSLELGKRGATLLTLVGDLTFVTLRDVLRGRYGKRPLDPEHAVLVVNPWLSFGKGEVAIGQPWQQGLKADAREMLDDTQWVTVYALRVRTSRGRPVLLERAGPDQPWGLYYLPDGRPVAFPDSVRTDRSQAPSEREIELALDAAGIDRDLFYMGQDYK